MKVRRRTTGGFTAGRLFAWFRPRDWIAAFRRDGAGSDRWLERVDTSTAAGPPAVSPPSAAPATPSRTGGPPAGSPSTPTTPGSRGVTAVRRAFERWVQLVKRQPVPWMLGGVFAGTALAGYLFAALVMFPAPFVPSTVSVPELVGLSETAATELLAERGLPVGETTREPHDRSPAGQVIWQEPPANARVSELTSVQLVISNGPRRIPVPDVSGFEIVLARRLIEATGLTVGGVETVQTAVPRDVVVNTRPAPGATLLPGAGVTLVMSVGAPTLSLPDLAGLTLDQARDTLEASGLALGDFYRQTSSFYPEGTIMQQRPAAGTLIAPGTAVNVVIARRPQ